ncbi:MAG: hypothetical protein Kow0029_29310 [Candidatus Rifleibacteriota bacterium]
MSKVFYFFLAVFFIVSLTTMAVAAPGANEVARIKLVNNNHVPQKVLVCSSYSTSRFVRDLFNIVKEINESENLSGDELIKLHIISSGGNPLDNLGVPIEVAQKYAEVNGNFSSGDIWLQDCMELCSAQLKNGNLVPAVFDSNRGRGLARLPRILADMWDLVYFKNPSNYQSHGDYGGNLEVTPFDDIMVAGDTITDQCRTFFENHGYKGRMFLPNTHWLQVGHIDEYLSFIPTPYAPGGYTIVRADTGLALDLIKNAPDSEFSKISSYDRNFLLRVKALLNQQMKDPYAGKGTEEGEFIALNHKINEIIEENVGKLKEFIRNTTKDYDRDIEEVYWPSLFEGRNSDNPRGCHAYLPGVVNLLVLRNHLIVPATHIPAFDTVIEARLRAQGNEVHFVDDTPYHNSMGEIHCGTNVLRDPVKSIITKQQVDAVRNVRNRFKEIHHN